MPRHCFRLKSGTIPNIHTVWEHLASWQKRIWLDWRGLYHNAWPRSQKVILGPFHFFVQTNPIVLIAPSSFAASLISLPDIFCLYLFLFILCYYKSVCHISLSVVSDVLISLNGSYYLYFCASLGVQIFEHPIHSPNFSVSSLFEHHLSNPQLFSPYILFFKIYSFIQLPIQR